MQLKEFREKLITKKRVLANTLYMALVSIILLPQHVLAGTTDGAKDAAVDPGKVADKASGVVTYVASCFAGAIGLYMLIAGIQDFSQARESHDSSTQIKAVSKILSGALAAVAGGVAAWLKANAK